MSKIKFALGFIGLLLVLNLINLSGATVVTIHVFPSYAGKAITTSPYDWNTTNVSTKVAYDTLFIKEVPSNGYRFVDWTCKNCNITHPNATFMIINLSKINQQKLNITAHFASNSTVSPVGVSSKGSGLSSASLISKLCSAYNSLKVTIYVLCLVLALLGAAVYGVGHVLPATSRGSIQSYGMGMVMAAIIAVIMVTLGIFIISSLAGPQYANSISACSGILP